MVILDGTVRFIYKFFNLNSSSVSDNVSGLLMMTFMASVSCVCFGVLLVMAVRKRCKSSIDT